MNEEYNRRRFIQTIFLGSLILTCSCQRAPRLPNILLIISEDGGTDLGCYGNAYNKTPQLDSLARKGILFTNAYVTQAGCSPSRSSILTGTFPHENGQIGLATHKYRLYKESTTNIISSLKEAGYRTGLVGKLHVNPEENFPFDFRIDGPFIHFDRYVRKMADAANGFITQSNAPFFLMVCYMDTHTADNAKGSDVYPKQKIGLPANPLKAENVEALPALGVTSPQIKATTANYYNCWNRLDTGVGILLDYLKKAGKDKNTLIIFLSDHGPQMSRAKMTNYDFGTHVPLIIYDPKVSRHGKVNHELVSTIDLAPTLLEYAGIKKPGNLNGKSLLPFIRGKSVPWRDYLFTEFTVHWPETCFPQRSVRDKQYKLTKNLLTGTTNPLYNMYFGRYQWDVVENDLKSASPVIQKAYQTFNNPPPYELYDLKNDPYEFVNLADKPEIKPVLDRLLNQLEKWQQETDDPLRYPEILKKLTEENNATMPNGVYENVSKKDDFQWKYPEYFFKR